MLLPLAAQNQQQSTGYCTLPLAADYSETKDLTVRNATAGNLQVKCQGSDYIDADGSPVSYMLAPGHNITLRSDGTDRWFPVANYNP